MKKEVLKIVSIILVSVILSVSLASCSCNSAISDVLAEELDHILKTEDLGDKYEGTLRKVLRAYRNKEGGAVEKAKE